LDVVPGQENEVRVEVVNRSDRDDRVGLRIQGIPANWVTAQSGFVSVPAGETVTLTAMVSPPLDQDIPTGRQRALLELVSQQNPNLNASTSVNLNIAPFFSFTASLEPRQVRLPGKVTVSVQNTGNASGSFSVIPRDSQNALVFSGESARLPLQPNQIARVELDVKERETTLLGGGELYPYEVNVVSREGGRQQLEAEAESGSMIPVWLLYVLIFLCTLACAALTIAAIFNFDRLFGQSATPTLPIAGIIATQTSASMTQTAVIGTGTVVGMVDLTATAETATAQANLHLTATSSAATAAAQGDSDGDGLSNAQEEMIGTDPFNADTDADQLGDGQEVLVYATMPTNSDTDMDGFSDGQEVLVLGSDPLDPFDPVGPGPMPPDQKPPMPPGNRPPGPPTRTRGPWPGPPSPTPSLPPPASPTFTPLPTATWTPSATPGATDTATPTYTAEPPTNTPIPTSTPSPTVTNTPEPPPGPFTISCAPAPIIDGNFEPSTWPSTPFAIFTAPTNPARRVEVYFVKNGQYLYLAYLMNDPVNDATDQLRVSFDALGNQGDPDAADRLLLVDRDGDWEVWAGIGSNSDFQLWDSTYSGSNWIVMTSDSGSQWVAEIQIDVNSEMTGLTDPFNMMSQVQFTSALATWPTGANGNDATTWQSATNPACP
jgi:hypothetical protein